MSDYLINEYNRKIEAALAEWSSATLAAAVELRMALEQRNKVYIEGPPTPKVRTVEHKPFVIDSDEGAGAEPETPADGDENAPGSAGETRPEGREAA
jgi:hypothetical protein